MSGKTDRDPGLRAAFAIYNEKHLCRAADPDRYRDIVLPDTLEKRMGKLIRQQGRPGYFLWNTTGKRAACILAALLIGLTSVTFSVKAVREPVVAFITKIYDRFTEIIFPGSDTPADDPGSPVGIEPRWPSYLPDGCTVTKESVLHLRATRVYQDPDGRTLIYSLSFGDGSAFRIDTEGAAVKEIVIGQRHGLFSEKDGEHILIVTDGSYVYAVTGLIPESEMIKMIASIE